MSKNEENKKLKFFKRSDLSRNASDIVVVVFKGGGEISLSRDMAVNFSDWPKLVKIKDFLTGWNHFQSDCIPCRLILVLICCYWCLKVAFALVLCLKGLVNYLVCSNGDGDGVRFARSRWPWSLNISTTTLDIKLILTHRCIKTLDLYLLSQIFPCRENLSVENQIYNKTCNK